MKWNCNQNDVLLANSRNYFKLYVSYQVHNFYQLLALAETYANSVHFEPTDVRLPCS